MKTRTKALAFAAINFFFMSGFGDKHSSLETKVNSSNPKSLVFQFIVKPDAGMKITKEGPWSLTLTQTAGLTLEVKDGKYVSRDLIETLPGFEVKTDVLPGVTQGKIEYVVKAFVCSDDKKHCYPQAHKGSLDWNQKKS